MRVTQYDVELDETMHPVLIKERGINYSTNSKTLSSPQTIVDMCNEVFRMKRLAEEKVLLIALNAKGAPLGTFEVFRGAVNYSIINARELFIRLLLVGAVCFVVVHNHPSGDITPSEEDIAAANRIQEVGRLMNIAMLDFIIIGDGFLSFHEKGIL